ncbi:hypothetical protein F5884DRAFT_796815 [Xylogone sp. PMI_703]|nr:hypothetical protein F5884DRAFT_796815 [Xylogone sp. PMI_703]
MAKSQLIPKKWGEWVEGRVEAIWANLMKNNLWQRILKNTIATTATIILALSPTIVRIYGRAAYLGAITTVFGHPGRRFGMMAEALVLAISGTLLGTAWSTLGLYLSSLIFETNRPAAYTIRGIFLAIALLFHGLLRSHTPRLFIFVLLLVIVSVVSLTGTSTEVTRVGVTTLLYPILTASAILLAVNTLIFPEFSSGFLGTTTIETLNETVEVLRDAGQYFLDTLEESNTAESKSQKENDNDPQNNNTSAEVSDSKAAPSDSHISAFRRLLKPFHAKENKATEKSATAQEDSKKKISLKSLTDSKAKLRNKLASCKDAQQECNFELAWAVLPPRDMKPISKTYMNSLVANTIALIGACESKYALMGDMGDKDTVGMDGTVEQSDAAVNTDTEAEDIALRSSSDSDSSDESSSEESDDKKGKKAEQRRKRSRWRRDRNALDREKEDLELIKPKKEIEYGDVELLRHLVTKVRKPLIDLQKSIDTSVNVVSACLAYCYDVPKLPTGTRPPKGIHLQEIDIRVDILSDAITQFDKASSIALEKAAALDTMDTPQIDIAPRMETFLISSFLLNLRQAAHHTLDMLKHSRVLAEKRQMRHDRRRIYLPKIKWRKWLMSGGEQDMLALPDSARKDARTGHRREDDEDDELPHESAQLVGTRDVESGEHSTAKKPRKKNTVKTENGNADPTKSSFVSQFRNGLADFIEYLTGSEDVRYALKLTIAVFLVLWPAFLHQWNAWFSLNRGLWAALQLVLITEVAIGTSIVTFSLRAVGTTIGCIWGYAAYEARNGNKVVCVVMLVIGIIPSAYIHIGTKYVKAGIVLIVSMCIVVLSTEDQTVPGTATENFLKRLLAFLIGGVVALFIEVIIFPVRARDRFVESLAASVRRISEMESCLAVGIESESNVNVHSKNTTERFERAKSKAQAALAAAETLLPFCSNEPRLKGSFRGLALIYAEVLYVLHAIVDRMDNMLHIRQEYGSGVLEELNTYVYPYRRNVAGSITLILFAVHEALTTKLPLPQFLPSARLAHLRMINRVREVMRERTTAELEESRDSQGAIRPRMERIMIKRIVRQKYLSWNAATSGQIEVIEYLEELVDLTKLLVGVNEFRSGMLSRPDFRESLEHMEPAAIPESHDTTSDRPETKEKAGDKEINNTVPHPVEAVKSDLKRRRPTLRRESFLEKKRSREQEVDAERGALEEDQLPISLQRVRTHRMEERHMSVQTREKEKDKEKKKA